MKKEDKLDRIVFVLFTKNDFDVYVEKARVFVKE